MRLFRRPLKKQSKDSFKPQQPDADHPGTQVVEGRLMVPTQNEEELASDKEIFDRNGQLPKASKLKRYLELHASSYGAIKVVKLEANGLQHVPPALQQLLHLVEVSLAHNALEQVPAWLCQRQLHILSFHHNPLLDLPGIRSSLGLV